MPIKNILEEIRDTIYREERMRELIGEEIFCSLSLYEIKNFQLIEQLAEILVDIFLEQEK